jgi:serine protease AprX
MQEKRYLTEVQAHDHTHGQNRFAVIPTPVRLDADEGCTGRGVTIALLDSGFYPHPDLTEPFNRIKAFKDITGQAASLESVQVAESWQWHGTQTAVVAAGNGRLSDGVYRSLAPAAELVLVKVSDRGRISEEAIARGIEWVREHRDEYDIRVLSISLGGDQDVPCSQNIVDRAAEEAIRQGIAVVAAAGNDAQRTPVPPANSPSVITVGGYDDCNQLEGTKFDLYHSSFGQTADGHFKPELIAPAIWVAAPILPGTNLYSTAENLSQLAQAPDYRLRSLAGKLSLEDKLPPTLFEEGPGAVRAAVESLLREHKIVAAHYQHVDGTSFAAPIVASVIAQMIEANNALTPASIKSILVSTATRLGGAPALRQGFGLVHARRAVEMARLERHDLKDAGSGPPRIMEGKLVFLFHDDGAENVSLAGDFNGWNPSETPFVKEASGLWRAEIRAPQPGRYRYKFVVNGHRWTEDPGNRSKTPDEFGGLNSLLFIEADSSASGAA